MGRVFDTTKWCCEMAGDVLKTLAALTRPSTSARAVTAPPPSSMARKLPGLMSRPYFRFNPGSPDGRFWNDDEAPNFTSGECAARSAIVFRCQSRRWRW